MFPEDDMYLEDFEPDILNPFSSFDELSDEGLMLRCKLLKDGFPLDEVDDLKQSLEGEVTKSDQLAERGDNIHGKTRESISETLRSRVDLLVNPDRGRILTDLKVKLFFVLIKGLLHEAPAFNRAFSIMDDHMPPDAFLEVLKDLYNRTESTLDDMRDGGREQEWHALFNTRNMIERRVGQIQRIQERKARRRKR